MLWRVAVRGSRPRRDSPVALRTRERPHQQPDAGRGRQQRGPQQATGPVRHLQQPVPVVPDADLALHDDEQPAVRVDERVDLRVRRGVERRELLDAEQAAGAAQLVSDTEARVEASACVVDPAAVETAVIDPAMPVVPEVLVR